MNTESPTGRRSFLKHSAGAALAVADVLQGSRAWRATAAGADYAESRHVDLWLRHPVYGDPSFDSFERLPGNPILTGEPPYEWPVNGVLFCDPTGGNWYLYAVDWAKGYRGAPGRCDDWYWIATTPGNKRRSVSSSDAEAGE